MINAKCINKFRDSQDRIIGYRLVDYYGCIQDISADNLKHAIKYGKIHICNLTLTSDNRLVDTGIKCNETITQIINCIFNTDYKKLTDVTYNYRLQDDKAFIYVEYTSKLECSKIKGIIEIRKSLNDESIQLIYDKELVISTKNKRLILGIIRSLLWVVPIDTMNKLANISDYDTYIRDSFESYTGKYTYIDEVLDKQHRMDADDDADAKLYIHSMLQASLMEIAYDSSCNESFNGLLFRGERFTDASYISGGFTSLTHSLDMAWTFTSASAKNTNIRILVFDKVNYNDIIDITSVSVYEEEHEVLLRSNIKVQVGNRIGTYGGVPMYLARYTKTTDDKRSSIKYIVQSFVKAYNNSTAVYGMAYLINKIRNIEDINFRIGNGNIEITFKNNKVVMIGQDGDNIKINNNIIYEKEDARKIIDSIIN